MKLHRKRGIMGASGARTHTRIHKRTRKRPRNQKNPARSKKSRATKKIPRAQKKFRADVIKKCMRQMSEREIP